MVQVSYSNVFSIDHHRGYEEDIQPGDVVRTGPNVFPQWQVIAIHGERAWLRNVQSGADGVTDLSRCRKIAA